LFGNALNPARGEIITGLGKLKRGKLNFFLGAHPELGKAIEPKPKSHLLI